MSKHRDNPDWLDELYESSSQETPPPALDAQLRATARSAGVVKPLERPWFRRPALLGGLATAATLVLGVSIGLSSLTQDPTPAPASTPARLLELEEARSPSPRQAPRALVSTDSAATAEELAGVGTAAAADPAAAEKSLTGEALAADLRAQEGLAHSRFASRTTAAASSLDPASATSLLLPTLDPTECATVAFVDVQLGAPYALCGTTTLLELHHADCDVPYVLRPGAIVTSATPGWLAISDGGEQLRLRCGPGGWLPSEEGAASAAERSDSEDEPDP